MEETTIEVVVGILARFGIITAHAFEFIGGYHTITIVALLWSAEEVVSIVVSSRHLRQKHQKIGCMEKRIASFLTKKRSL